MDEDSVSVLANGGAQNNIRKRRFSSSEPKKEGNNENENEGAPEIKYYKLVHAARPFRLLDFSDEMLFEIFQYLDTWTLMALMNCCSRLSSFVLDHRFWNFIDLSKEPLPLGILEDVLERSHANTVSMKLHGPPVTQHIEREDRQFNQTLANAFATCCTNLRVLELQGITVDFRFVKITDFPSTLQRLILNNCSVRFEGEKSIFFGIEVHLTRLEVLAIENSNWFEPYYMMVFSKIPELRSLSLKGCQLLSDFVPYGSMAARFGFKKLEFLDLRFTPISDSDLQCFNAVSTLKEIVLDCPESLRENNEEDAQKTTTKTENNRCPFLQIQDLSPLAKIHNESLPSTSSAAAAAAAAASSSTTSTSPSSQLKVTVEISPNLVNDAKNGPSTSAAAAAETLVATELSSDSPSPSTSSAATVETATASSSISQLPSPSSYAVAAAETAAATVSLLSSISAAVIAETGPLKYASTLAAATESSLESPSTSAAGTADAAATESLWESPSSSAASSAETAAVTASSSTSSSASLSQSNSQSLPTQYATLNAQQRDDESSLSSCSSSPSASSTSSNESLPPLLANYPRFVPNHVDMPVPGMNAPPFSRFLPRPDQIILLDLNNRWRHAIRESRDSRERAFLDQRAELRQQQLLQQQQQQQQQQDQQQQQVVQPHQPQPHRHQNEVNHIHNHINNNNIEHHNGNHTNGNQIERVLSHPLFWDMVNPFGRVGPVGARRNGRDEMDESAESNTPRRYDCRRSHCSGQYHQYHRHRHRLHHHPISDRGICCFGRPRNPVEHGIIWIRIGNRPSENRFERLSIRNYKLVTDISLQHLVQCSPFLVYLDLSGTSVTQRGIDTFKEIKPECTIRADHLYPPPPPDDDNSKPPNADM